MAGIFKGMNGPRLRIIDGIFRTETREPPPAPQPVVAEQVDFSDAFPPHGLTVADRAELQRIYERVAATLDSELTKLDAEVAELRKNGRTAAFTIMRPLITNLSALRHSRLFTPKSGG